MSKKRTKVSSHGGSVAPVSPREEVDYAALSGIFRGRPILQAGCTTITNHDYEEPITGLGIMAACQTVSDHGGAISYASESGHGTTFRLTLPLASSQ